MIAFHHGVASADPLPDGVLLWTRCTPATQEPIGVEWWISRDPAPAADQIVAGGTAHASAESDFTVHVDVSGLDPATTYWYGFRAGDAASPVGRTRTAPSPDGPPGTLRIGLASCAHWSCGFFNAYAALATRDLDLVIHVGDYIYENDFAGRRPRAVRAHRPPGTLVTLADYRARHAQYRTDPDLQALHARHPVAAVWDDHEIAGGTWRGGATAHAPARHGLWGDRRAAALQAYFEWMPVRRPDHGSVYRTIRLGPLADLVLLDTRLVGRDRPATNARRPVLRVDAGDRSLLGEDQWRWLEGELASSTGRWLLVGNQVMMAPLRLIGVGDGIGINPSQWDGYPAERRRFYDLLARSGRTSNVAVLSGDIHSSWAADLPVGAEFVSPSVTSTSFARSVLPDLPGVAALARRWFLTQNRHLRLADLSRHGYVTVEVGPDRIQGDWWEMESVGRRDRSEEWGGGWVLDDGRPALRAAGAPVELSPP